MTNPNDVCVGSGVAPFLVGGVRLRASSETVLGLLDSKLYNACNGGGERGEQRSSHISFYIIINIQVFILFTSVNVFGQLFLFSSCDCLPDVSFSRACKNHVSNS